MCTSTKAASSKVVNQSATYFVDVGSGARYGQINNQGGTAAGGAAGDNRMVHISWLNSANGGTCGAPDVDVGQLTVFRDLRYVGISLATDNTLEDTDGMRGGAQSISDPSMR